MECPDKTKDQVKQAEDFLSGLADMGVLGANLGVYIGGCGMVLEKVRPAAAVLWPPGWRRLVAWQPRQFPTQHHAT